MRKSELTDAALCAAVSEMEAGLIDADLGKGVLKKRVALRGRGKRGGARTIVASNRGSLWFFLFGFAKNDRESISDEELESLQRIAQVLLGRSKAELDALVGAEELKEICDEEKAETRKPNPR